jgi:hypothetical protein
MADKSDFANRKSWLEHRRRLRRTRRQDTPAGQVGAQAVSTGGASPPRPSIEVTFFSR